MLDAFNVHRDWWLKVHGNDVPYIASLGLLKALRNYVNPKLKGQSASTEALGDLLCYCFSIHHANGWELLATEPLGSGYIEQLVECAALVIAEPRSRPALRSMVQATLAACRNHGVQPESTIRWEKQRC